MSKTLKQKLNKKGFTLAELLVVVAIVAILVAIAIPIFTGAMRDAQLRVNQANVRSVRAAAVTDILTNWNNKTTDSQLITAGEKNGWIAQAKVDQAGNITDLRIYNAPEGISEANVTGIDTVDEFTKASKSDVANYTIAEIQDQCAPYSETSGSVFALLKPTYYVQVYVKPVVAQHGA